MSDKGEGEDSRRQFWHRVTGVVVLTALAVILVPLIPDLHDGDDAAITRGNVPDRPPGFRIEEIPLMPPEAIRPTPPGSAQTAPDTTPAPAGTEAPDGPPPTAAAPESPPGPIAGPAFAVQVGSFSSEENATALRDRLRGQGYSAFVDRAGTDAGPMYRVLVGPDATREHGERLRDRIEREAGIRGVVVGYE